MQNNPVITAVTDVASPPERVWKELTDFAGYARWHPALRFVDVPTVVLPGTLLRARVSLGTDNDGEYRFTVPVVVERDEDGVWCAHAQLRPGLGAHGEGDTEEAALETSARR